MKNENHCSGVFDRLNEASWYNDYHTKNTVLFKKNPHKLQFSRKFLFLVVPPGFLRNVTLQRDEFFLRCNQCNVTILLSYQTPLHNDFYFLHYNGSVCFLRPLGVKNQLGKKRKKSVLI